jgi:diguanylate cyclase (GGDEF)-like protein
MLKKARGAGEKARRGEATVDGTGPVEPGGDPLVLYRERIMYALAIAAVVFLVPFAVNAFVQGNPGLGAGILCGVAVLGVNALAIYLKRSPPLPMILLLVPMIAATAISLRVQGFFGALWCYPTILLFTFALSRRMANICSALLLVCVSALVYYYIGVAYTIRFSLTLTLTIILANLVLSIIGDLYRRLADQAVVDPLTGAFNRRYMERCMGDTIERQRRSTAPASVLLIDIDHFKRINDRLGHAKGDSVLKAVVALIRKRARKLDLLFRIGGEEFILLLPDTREGDAAALAEQLRASIAESTLLEDGPVTASIGVSELRAVESLDSWMKRADDAMYAAKKAGRNRVVRATMETEECPAT